MKGICFLRIVKEHLLLVAMIIPASAFSQAETSSPLKPSAFFKAGGFIYFSEGEVSSYSLGIELEKALNRRGSLSAGPRIDFLHNIVKRGTWYTPDLGPKLFLGYELKYYPFQGSAKKPYRGAFIGGELLFLMQRPSNEASRYGPGVAGLFGYQFYTSSNIALCLEGTIVYFQNVNAKRASSNEDDRYFFLFSSFKVAFKLRQRKNRL